MVWLWPAVTLLVGAMILGRRSTSSTARPVGPGQWVDPDAPRRIRELAERIGWPGLADFLVAKAYWESRGNSQAGGDGANAARGWFGIRPHSARVADLGLSPGALKDEALSVALAGWYAARLQAYATPRQRVDWLAIARGWYLPSLVDDAAEIEPASVNVHDALGEAFAKAGLDPNRMFEPVDFSGWPGVTEAIGRVTA